MTLAVRTLPKNREIEQAILATIMFDPETHLPDVLEAGITQEIFYWQSHATIFRAIVSLADSHQSPDLLTVTNWLDERKLLGPAGGVAYVTEVFGIYCGSGAFREYLKVIKSHHTRRCLIEYGLKIEQLGYDEEDPEETLAIAELSISQIRDGLGARQSVVPINEVRESAIEYFKEMVNGTNKVSTGISPLDVLLKGGFRRDSYNFIFARQKSGKSALACNMALRWAQAGSGVLYVSLEMTNEELIERMVRTLGPHGLDSFNLGNEGAILETFDKLNELPIHFYEGSTRLTEILSAAQRAVTKHGVKFVIVENHDLITLDREYVKDNERLAESSKGIKRFTRKIRLAGYSMVFLLVGQANREAGKQADAFPKKGHVAGSDQVGRDADCMICLADPEITYHERPNQMGIKIAACRSDSDFAPVFLEYSPSTFGVGVKAADPF